MVAMVSMATELEILKLQICIYLLLYFLFRKVHIQYLPMSVLCVSRASCVVNWLDTMVTWLLWKPQIITKFHILSDQVTTPRPNL